MQIISLGKDNLDIFRNEFLILYPRRKVLIIKLKSDMGLTDCREVVDALTQRDVDFIFSFDEQAFAHHPLFVARTELALKKILITQKLDYPQAGPVSPRIYRDTPHLTGASERMHEYGWRYPDVTFYSELVLEESALDFIGPFAKYYFGLGRD